MNKSTNFLIIGCLLSVSSVIAGSVLINMTRDDQPSVDVASPIPSSPLSITVTEKPFSDPINGMKSVIRIVDEDTGVACYTILIAHSGPAVLSCVAIEMEAPAEVEWQTLSADEVSDLHRQ